MRSELQLADGSLFDIRWPARHMPIRALAIGCARACRYAGQIPLDIEHYSVAEHMVHVGRAVRAAFATSPLPRDFRDRLIRTAYLHDLQEGVLGDMPTPLKQHCPDYLIVEDDACRSIARVFGTIFPLPRLVERFDRAIILDERLAIDGKIDRARWGFSEEEAPLGIEICFWTPKQAFAALMGDLEEIGVLRS